MALLSSATLLKAPISSDLGEEPLNHIEPGGRGGCEVQMEAGARFDPALYSWGRVSGIVVYDEMEIETSGGLLIDQLEKAQDRYILR
jgi:hypothetical protein